jgi:hypothetical protein
VAFLPTRVKKPLQNFLKAIQLIEKIGRYGLLEKRQVSVMSSMRYSSTLPFVSDAGDVSGHAMNGIKTLTGLSRSLRLRSMRKSLFLIK